MKNLILALLLFLSVKIIAQIDLPIDSITKRVVFTQIAQVDSLTQAEILAKANEWIALNFTSAKDVVQLNNAETGKIIVKGNFTSYAHALIGSKILDYGIWKFTLVFEAKVSRYRISFTDLVHEHIYDRGSASGGNIENLKPDCGNMHLTKKSWLELKMSAKTSIEKYLKDIKMYISQKKNNDKW